MTITRAMLEKVLINRVGKKLTLVGKDGTTTDGTNSDLDDALSLAIRGLGITPSNPLTVSDADLTSLAIGDLDQLLDVAQLRLLESIRDNIDFADTQIGPRSESLSDLATQVEKAIGQLTAKVEKRYGLGVGTLEAGVISLDFAEKDDDERA